MADPQGIAQCLHPTGVSYRNSQVRPHSPFDHRLRDIASFDLDRDCGFLHDGIMDKNLPARLKAARIGKGLTQQAVADTVGVSRAAVAQWEAGKAEPSIRNMKLLDDLIGSDTSEKSNQRQITEAVASHRLKGIEKAGDPNYLLVRFIMAGVKGECFVPSQVQEDFAFIHRPEVLVSDSNAYCILVASEAMAPRYHQSELIYVSPKKPYYDNDYVVVYFKETGPPAQPIVRRLISATDDVVIVRRYQPSSIQQIQRSTIYGIHRIVPWNELLNPASWMLYPTLDDDDST